MKNIQRIKDNKSNNSFSVINIDSMEKLDFKNDPKQKKKLIDALKMRHLNENNELRPYSICDNIEKLKNQGEGLYFYFYFMKFFGIVFLILSIFSIFSIFFTTQGDGLKLKSGINFFLSTTLANIKKLYYDEDEINNLKNLSENEVDSFVKDKNDSLDKEFYIILGAETLICLFFFISIYVFQIKVARKIKEISKKKISARKYTLMIKGFPKNVLQDDIREFFSQFGIVKDVAFAYEYKNCLINIVKLVKYKKKMIKLDMLKKKNKNEKIQKLLEKMKKETKIILKKLGSDRFDIANLSTLNVIRTFVTFENAKTPQNVVIDFKEKYTKTICQKICCSKQNIPEKYLFKKKQIKLKFHVPDHPKNIIWENLEFGKFYQRNKFILTLIVAIIILILSFSITSFLNAYTESIVEVSCNNKSITQNQILKTLNIDEKNELIYCYCNKLSVSILLNGNKEDFDYKFCYDQMINEAKKFAISFGIGIFISVVNNFIQFIIFKMVLSIKYYSITEIVKKQINFSIWVEYFNTCFVLYFIYSEYKGFSITKIFNKITNTNFIDIDGYITDVNRQWYNKVGSKLIMPLFISIISPHFEELIIVILGTCWKSLKVRWAKTKGEFISIMKFDQFNLGFRLKNVLLLFICCFTFSAGLPIFNVFICIGIFLTFWFHKIILIKFSDKPPPYSNEIIKSCYKILKIGLIIHMIFAIYFLSNDDIFPTEMNFSLESTSIKLTYNDQNSQFYEIFQRLWKVFPLVIVLALMIIFYFFEFVFFKILISFFQLFKKEKIFSANDIQYDNYDDNLKLIKSHGLANYQIKLNPEYRNILNFSIEDVNRLKNLAKSDSFVKMLKVNSIEKNFQNDYEPKFRNSNEDVELKKK